MICRKIVPLDFEGNRWMCIGFEVRKLDDFVL